MLLANSRVLSQIALRSFPPFAQALKASNPNALTGLSLRAATPAIIPVRTNSGHDYLSLSLTLKIGVELAQPVRIYKKIRMLALFPHIITQARSNKFHKHSSFITNATGVPSFRSIRPSKMSLI